MTSPLKKPIRAPRAVLLALPLLALSAVALASPSTAKSASDCNEACLLNIAGAYLDSLSANDPAGAPVDAHLRATENGVVTPLTAGLWTTAQGWSYRHTLADPVTGEIAALGVVTEGKDHDAMVALRLKVVHRKIVESELIVAREGDFGLFQPHALTEPKPIFTSFLPVDRRDSRAALSAIPARYFAALASGDNSTLPVHPDANRIENGVQTTNNAALPSPSAHEGLQRFVYMAHYRNMRVPVVDQARGLALAVIAVDMPEMTRTLSVRGKPVEINPKRQHLPRTMFMFELFKVEDGQIRAIEAVMRNMPLGADMGWPGASH